MPIMDGKQLIINIRKFEYENDIPKSIIAVLSADELEDSQLKEIGSDFILKKPLSYETLNIFLKKINII